MSVALVERPLTSTELCELVGISYRQLDYLCRCGAIPGDWQPGSGGRRGFEPDVVARFVVAATIRDATPFGSDRGPLTWPSIVALVMAGPQPPRRAFAIVGAHGGIRYEEIVTVDNVVEGGLIAPYTLDDL